MHAYAHAAAIGATTLWDPWAHPPQLYRTCGLWTKAIRYLATFETDCLFSFFFPKQVIEILYGMEDALLKILFN